MTHLTNETIDQICDLVGAPDEFDTLVITIKLETGFVSTQVTNILNQNGIGAADIDPDINQEEIDTLLSSDGDDNPGAWPKQTELGTWEDSEGAIYDPEQHAWNRDTGQPSIKANGTFRKAIKRGGDIEPAKKRGFTESQIDDATEKNIILGALATHIDGAQTRERLADLMERNEATMLSDYESAIFSQMINDRMAELEA